MCLIEVKHFGEGEERRIGGTTVERLKKRRHVCLPARINGLVLHAGDCGCKIGGFEVADEETIVTQKERVIVPSVTCQGGEHFGPDGLVACFVLCEAVGADFEQKTNSLHG